MVASFYRRYGKRLFDLSLAFISMAALAPIYIFISLLLVINQGRPILFLQRRAGYKGRPFTIYKFRTMNDNRDKEGNLLPDSARLTRIGKFLRKTSLDELPELFNVLKGDMSLVGPRPLLLDYLRFYNKDHLRRQDVRPGITGLAQINGRQLLPFSKRLELDVNYVDNFCFPTDINIILLTIKKIFTGEGVVLGQNVLDVDDIGLSRRIRK